MKQAWGGQGYNHKGVLFQLYSYCRSREHKVYIIKTLCYPLAQGNSGCCLPRRSLKEEDLGLDLLAALLFSLGD